MQETAEGKYTRISEAWSKNFDKVRISQTLLALKGHPRKRPNRKGRETCILANFGSGDKNFQNSEMFLPILR